MDALEQIFLDFTSFGAGQSGSSEMDSAKFVKLAKDCKLVGKNLSTTDLDLIFTKVKVGEKLSVFACVGIVSQRDRYM
ncbi:unnamed protein product [Ectocarpus sp. 13 AM-2016]